ncbi:hypothetical protein AVEN_5395-1 [Araneus ventricosus]|uniref:Uncharacterized protein n=1 Tax=Araneus ventricosus TaxID=182803 RepID=A0A4Y2SYR7_ARAVE|nr:hypothetical protein AVEN_5395-1 [Araneus ventricosus]
MSPSASENDITAMSYRFAVKWSIPVEDLKSSSSSDEIITRTLRSNRYRFKNIENLYFTFILTCGKDFIMRVENWNSRKMFQDDALILIEDRIYRLKCNPNNTLGRLIFDQDVLDQNSFKDDKVTFHCIMSIHAQAKLVVSEFPPFRTAYPEVNRNKAEIVEFESLVVTEEDLYPHGYDAVNDFRYSSSIPDFSVKLAISLIGEAHKRHDPILKALCSEYLMENLTTENVAAVLKQSLESEAKDLSQSCADFLNEQCKIVPH